MITKTQQIDQVRQEIEQLAEQHLKAQNATTALRHFSGQAVVASNHRIFNSFHQFSTEIREFYRTIEKILKAEWSEKRIDVIDENLATFTGKFKWCSMHQGGETTALTGVWSAMLVREKGEWKIRMRHEHFVEMGPFS